MNFIEKNPNLIFGLSLTTIAAMSGISVYTTPSYHVGYYYGKIEGYNVAKEEIKKQGKENMIKTLMYAEQNLNEIKNGGSIHPKYMNDTMKLWCLPTWNLKLLGDEYTIYMTSKENFKRAWIVKKDDSDKLSVILQNILNENKDENKNENEMKLDEKKRNIRTEIYNIISKIKK